MESVKLLISAYLDNEINAQESEQLAACLQADNDAVDRFVMDSFIHSQLLYWLNEPVTAGDMMIATVAERSSFGDRSAQRRYNGVRRHLKTWAALAAALLVSTTIGSIAYLIMSRPVYVATLTEAAGCRWSAATSNLGVGSFLKDEQTLDLVTGRAEITFASGAKLMLEAPASVRLSSQNEVRLETGRIAAKVPRQAVGFTVSSNLAKFVDLGTAFTLSLEKDKAFQLHVFEGLVEVRLDPQFGERATRPAYIAEVRAVSFDTTSGDLETIQFEEGKQMPF
jgi:hypothetical protein